MAESEHLPAPLSELDEDRMQLYDVLARNGIEGRDAHLLTQLIENMASANLIHRFENKLEAVNDKFNLLLWFIGIGVIILATVITLS